MGWNTPPNHFRPIQVISEKRIVLCKTRTGKPGDGRVPQSPVCDVSGDTMGFLAGKRLLITGVLSNRSIAYGIARACKREGAELAFSYVGERFKDRITEFAAEFGSSLAFDCDVADDAAIERLFAELGASWPKFDGFVHS